MLYILRYSAMTVREFAVALLFCGGAAWADIPAPLQHSDFRTIDRSHLRLGQMLFYDPILSGNQNISCATCHHPRLGTSDGMSLSLGEGGIGLGPDRYIDPDNRPEQRIPRNAPALFNLGAHEFTSLFHDGRLEQDDTRPSGLRTPLAEDMVTGFQSVLSAQTMFPVLSPDEMAGHYTENEIARAVRQGFITGPDGAWTLITARVATIPAYQEMFEAAVPEIAAGRPIAFTDISNVIATFMEWEWRADNSPFDQYVRGEAGLSAEALNGMGLFYGAAGCSTCHSGPFQTDHQFHAIAMPQFGPGKAARFESHAQDTGRMRVTGQDADAYAFRTPSLRNVAHTAPYGHSGAYTTLDAVIRHHLDPVGTLTAYSIDRARLHDVPEFAARDRRALTEETSAIAAANTLTPMALSDDDIAALIAFLHSLTDPQSIEGRLGVPAHVPSGLAVDQ